MMGTSCLIHVRRPDEQHIDEIVDIHRSVLGYTLNSQLGEEHLASMYRHLLNSPDCCVLVAYDGVRPIGVISGAVDMEQTKWELLKDFTFGTWLHILVAVIRKPWLIREWFKGNIIGRPVYDSKDAVAAILTTIAIQMDQQGKGVGRKLVESLEDFFRLKKVKSYRLDTLTSNTSARSFYKTLGFQEVDQRADSVVLVKRITEK